MKINIKATGIQLTPAISSYVQKKISAIDKYLDKNNKDIVALIEVGRSTRHHKTGNIFRAEVHIAGGGLDLYAVSDKEDLYAAVDVVKDDIVRELNKTKGKRFALMRRGGQMMKNMMKGLWERR